MGRGNPGKPGIRESRGTKQARQIRVLQDRVRRLEKMVKPPVVIDGGWSGAVLEIARSLNARFDASAHGADCPCASCFEPLLQFTPITFEPSKYEAERFASEQLTPAVYSRTLPDESDLSAWLWPWRAAAALHRFFSVGFPGRRSGAWPRWAADQGKPSLSDDTQ